MSIFVTAEIGINHNGDLDIAKNLIDIAADAGADAVKFQKRDIEVVYSQELLDGPRESPWGTTQREQKAGLEFSQQDYAEIDRYCREKSIEWFASSWDMNSQKFLRQFDCKYNKVASAMIIWDNLLKMIAEEGKHTFISTGMSTQADIENAVKIFRDAKCPFELMHCVSTYPHSAKDANLACIKVLREHFGCDVGYSGHEAGLAVSYGAAALGISSLERHITVSRAMYGSDQAASVEPAGFNTLVGSIRKIEAAMGDGKIGYHPTEVPIAKKLREHLTWDEDSI